MSPLPPFFTENTEKSNYLNLGLSVLSVFVPHNFADISSSCNSPRFNLSVVFLIRLLQSNSSKISFSISLLISLIIFLFYSENLKCIIWLISRETKSFLSCLHVAPTPTLLEKFSCKYFAPQKCEAKLVTVTN